MTEDLLDKLEVRADMLLDRLEKSEPGSKEESSTAEAIKKLFDVINNEYEISNRLAFEQERLEIEKERLALEQRRAEIEEVRNSKNDLWDKAFGVIAETAKIGTFCAGQYYISKRWTQGLLFESTGTIGSSMVRSAVNGVTKA